MNKFLKMSGMNWRKQQEKLAFDSKRRSYAVVEAALGKDVEECKIQAGVPRPKVTCLWQSHLLIGGGSAKCTCFH